jgi:glutaredoxin
MGVITGVTTMSSKKAKTTKAGKTEIVSPAAFPTPALHQHGRLASLLVVSFLTLLIAGLAGCDKKGSSGSSSDSKKKLSPIKVTSSAELLFTYKSGESSFETVDSMEKVPPRARDWVRVLDPSMRKPTGRLVYVADLCEKKDDGTFPYRVVARSVFEGKDPEGCSAGAALGPGTAAGAGAGTGAGAGAGGSAKVIIYVTSTCPVCANAIAYMRAKGITFVAKDVGKDPQAAKELAQKAARAGFRPTGVPVFDVGGKMIRGFDKQAISEALGK